MPVTPKPLASAIMIPTRSVTIPTTPGRQVQFRQGMATINNTDDLPYLLRRSDVRLMVTEYAMSWMPDVLKATGEVKAQVQWPLPVVEPKPDPIDEAINVKTRDIKGRWLKPPLNLSES